MTHDDPLMLLTRLASMPLSDEDLRSTWTPADWEDIVNWWDAFVHEARQITGKSYRNPTE